MKLALKLLVALAVGAVCVVLFLRNMDVDAAWRDIKALPLSGVGVFLLSLAVTHFFRAWRWEYLLRPVGVSLSMRELLPISTVGFAAILLLPVRLGELARPYFVVRRGRARMSAVLGTVAVERIVDGLLISIIFFTAYAASAPGTYPAGLRFAAWLSLLGFLGLTAFLACALAWTEPTIRFALAVTFLRRLSPRIAHKVEDKLRALIGGFRVLGDPGNLAIFLAQSVLYWGANGLGMWLLARAMHLEIPVSGAFATMSFTGVLISLPNSPGLVGQFHQGIAWGLSAYVTADVVASTGKAYAVVLHGLTFLWYGATGLLALLAIPGGAHSLRQVVSESAHAAAAEEGPNEAPETTDGGAAGEAVASDRTGPASAEIA